MKVSELKELIKDSDDEMLIVYGCGDHEFRDICRVETYQAISYSPSVRRDSIYHSHLSEYYSEEVEQNDMLVNVLIIDGV